MPLHRFADVIQIILRVNLVGNNAAAAVGETQFATVMFPGAVGRNEAHEERWKISEDLNLTLMRLHCFFPKVKRDLGGGKRFRQPRANFGATFFAQRAPHAARHSPRRMNFFVAENFNNFLAELTQADAGASQLFVRGNQAENIALRRGRVPAEQKIRRAQVKETQRVRLDELAEVQQPAQFVGGGRNIDGHQRVAGLGRGERVADGTDSADALRDARHLGVRPAFAKLFKAAKLDDMKFRVGDIAGVI